MLLSKKARLKRAAMAAKPEQGESKQDFLKRCMGGDTDQLPACAAAWNKATLSAIADKDTVTLLSEPGSVEAGNENGEFAILAYTGKVIDWWWMDPFVIDLSGMALAKNKVPALLEHVREWRVGGIDSGTASDSGFLVTGNFLSNDIAQGVRRDAADGYPWQASIGVQALRVEVLKEGESAEVNGTTVDGPIDIWRKASVFETSFCSFGADDDTAAVAMSATAINQQEESMDERLRMFLERRGLKQDATEQEAWAFLAKLDVEDEELNEAGLKTEDLRKPEKGPAPEKTTDPEPAPATKVKMTVDQALNLTSFGGTLGLTTDEITAALKDQTSEEKAKLRLYEVAAEKNPAFGVGRLQSGVDEADKFRMAAVDGVLFRMGQREEKPAPGFEEFRGLSVSDLARMCLERSGVNTRGLVKKQLAAQVLTLSGSTSSSDFGAIFMDVANKRMLKAYNAAPETWRPWVNIVTATDFKDMYGMALSDAPELLLVGENGEYKTGEFKDSQESFRVKTYGRIVHLTRTMIINDDLRAFSKIPRAFGAAAKRKSADIVYGLITSNPKMADGEALFSAAHRNLMSTDKGVVSSDTLSAARTKFKAQKDVNGQRLDMVPAFLLIPNEQETSSEVLLRSMALPTENMSSGVHNPWNGKLTPIAEGRLSDHSVTAWYLVGDPSQVDTIDVAYLDGDEQPYIEEHVEFERDALGIKCRFDFGAGVMDTKGFLKNPGV
ncbi:hypothetical protein ACR42D_10775 [Desulfovibrio caledoniensis]